MASVLTAAVAFVGIVLSNRAALARQRIELAAAAEKASKERDRSLRESIYLDMLNEVGSQMAHLLDVWNVEKDSAELSFNVAKVSGSTYRTFLVASPSAVRALVELNEVTSQAYMKALPLRIRYASVVAGRRRFENMLERIRLERERLVAEIDSGKPDETREAEIELRKKEQAKMTESIGESLKKHLLDTASAAMKILVVGSKARQDVDDKVVQFAIVVREELGLPPLGDGALEAIRGANGRSQVALEKTIAELDRMFPEVLAAATY